MEIGRKRDSRGHYTRLASVEEAEDIIAANDEAKEFEKQHLEEWKQSPEGKRELAIKSAVKAAIKALNEHGWYSDINGIFDGMESDIELKIRQFVEAVEPVN